ncbi:SCP2 sterol-binding domain-containing protein [Evansella clarkii]|jgi:putative sterol carrier protein|uniref:SCP2 sterol-binding domain-containing protein n=1 Tax=Evansella clarkii TaxID=79879 RepID=UPI00142F7625|nr:SCP2 sterol-binding domain-containing protein [Evansella clarkii]
MAVKEKFEVLTTRMNEDPSHLEGLNTVYKFNLTGDEEGTYQLRIADKKAEYTLEDKYEPTITLDMSDKNFLKLAENDLNPTMAYMSGKLKVKGDLSLALKLHSLLKKYQ